ncbi:lipase family alpha/beta hydrolase [Actinoplanes sp. CA-142083]|uniref:lipase family alpha/beta hydrolase n=1 Tax=Actinoplanes sp. CA-142083 TaxID=3239903 RepID=UPI003D905B3F
MIRRGLALMVLSVLAVLPLAAPASAAAPSCQGKPTDPGSNQSANRRPVIFVHGWRANGGALQKAGKALDALLDHRIQPFYFDYGVQDTTWAADPIVSGCLSQYIEKVSAAYYKKGGEGRVILVGHSMGGLASLYAATGNARADIGGLLTFDTPYLGSEFGDTGVAGWWQGVQQSLGPAIAPPVGSDAQICLGEHRDGAPLAKNCKWPLPKYLPAATPVTTIAGDVTIRRKFGGITLYNQHLNTDGVVSVPSSNGYLSMAKSADRPKKADVTTRTIGCVYSTDALLAAVLPTANASLIHQIVADISSAEGLFGHATLMAQFAPCGHSNIYNDEGAQKQAAAALKRYLDLLEPGTSIVNLAPVTQAGKVAQGWTTVDLTGDNGPAGVDCSINEGSPSAILGDIYYCSPVAASADACWVADNKITMLCLTDPMAKKVEMLPAGPDGMPTGPASHAEEALPIRLDLDNGDRCRLRNGGSWGGHYPDRIGWYGCEKAQAVWGTATKGIDKSKKAWTVKTGGETGPLTAHKVRKAYYVATAP